MVGDPGRARRRWGEAGAAAAIAAVLVLVVAPVPPPVLDALLAACVGLGAAMAAAAVTVRTPAAMAAFPSLVLLATLVRIGVVVALSRSLLGTGDAGAVATAFGARVAGGSLVVGAVVFAVLAIFQLLVVARGAERVAEVAARFALDAMPGKQLAIDADLRAGALDAAEAGRRRAALEREAQFFGAMDGAMKFVRGDAIAALLIVVVVTGAGLAVGAGVRGLAFSDAVARYALPALGAGLAVQLPALLTALAAAVLVTRLADAADDGDPGALGPLAEPRALGGAAAALAVLAAVPGLPAAPFVVLAAAAGAAAAWTARRATARRDGAAGAAVAVAGAPLDTASTPLAVEVGPGFAQVLAEPSARAALAGALDAVRQALFEELGVVAPPIAVRSGARLAEREVAIVVDGTPVEFADADGADGVAAVRAAVARGLRRVAHELLTLDAVQARLDELARTQPAAVREVVPRVAGLPVVAAVLRALAREQVSVRDLGAVLGGIAAQPAPAAGFGAGVVAALAERVRAALARQLTAAHAPRGALAAVTLDGMIEDAVRGALLPRDGGVVLALEPELARDIVAAARAALPPGEARVVLASSDIRRHLRALLEPEFPDVAVLAPHELAPGVTVRAAGRIAV